MKQYYDKNGIPVYTGDLLRSFHFRDRTRGGRNVYLYHVVVEKDGHQEVVPTQHMAGIGTGGRCWITGMAKENRVDAEVIDGPIVNGLFFYERPKLK